MTHYRTDLRTAARAAIAGSARFADFTQVKLWSKSIDYKTLPVFAVGTPNETCLRDGLDQTARTTRIIVAIKRLGGDELEDVLDEDSAEVERAVMAAFPPGAVDLTETALAEDSSGEQRVGTLTMTFAAPTWQSDPLT